MTTSSPRWTRPSMRCGRSAATGDPRQSRMLLADGASIGFALRCYVRSEAPADGAGSRLRPLWVRVVLTADYLLTLHEERVSLRRCSLPSCLRDGAGDTPSTPSSTPCSRAPSTPSKSSS